MKKFFYACLGILCLTLAFHFGATSAHGQSGSFFRVIPGSGYVVIGETVYHSNWNPPHWGPVYEGTLPPVQPSSIIYLGGGRLITESGSTWAQEGGGWIQIDPVPGGATPVIRTSFGQLKTQFR